MGKGLGLSRSLTPNPSPRGEGKYEDEQDGDDGLLDHFLLFNCYVADDESTLTIALLEVKGCWHGVEWFESEGEVSEE